MARTREFDTEAAVSRAMELFWARGYEATSVRDLTRHLGIGQGSLYAAFGDKGGLYRAALDHYRSTFAAAALRTLEGGADARSAVRAPRTPAPSNRSWRSPWPPSTDVAWPVICIERSTNRRAAVEAGRRHRTRRIHSHVEHATKGRRNDL
ncbi:TetR/AcrR family transcriptional regulator [Actinomadura nitritigenes]|uniref:TetR/AcrR family transcriptional regulator n=1 Tax=Actinomadura nitritigenes TaxID=134602 RepID=UPI003D92BE0D